jgi:RNA recognition motif-containing protein
MARRGNHTFAKRQREQTRADKKAQKAARKEARRDSPDDSPYTADPNTGPASAEEVARAVERAMNPGKVRQESPSRKPGASARLFVGNLDFGSDEADLRALFAGGGYEVVEARIVTDRQTGEPRGFAFVELSSSEEAEKAIEQFDGSTFHGRPLRINAADQRKN